MKKLLSFVVLMIISITSYAQEKDVTKFLGIPVDGTKAEMIAKLKEKGFTSTDYDKDILEGEFNGTDVNLHIATTNNKVNRIMLCDKNTKSETDIKIRFNILCNQFSENSKYVSLEDYTISEDEDISYEMSVKNKRYQAIFYQVDREKLGKILLDKYSIEQIQDQENWSDELRLDFALTIMKYCINKSVWFMISEYGGEYYITMFYDNELNKANGEDL